ncbi:MAG: hypothetical protein ACI83W_001874 [Marinoscillum sp.]|jgi:hypothetical protein
MQSFFKSFLFIILCTIAMVGYAQKGTTGLTNGVSSEQPLSELQKVEGTIEKIKTGPCQYTTGRYEAGTHLFVRANEDLYNVHLGPTSDISQLVSLSEGDSINVTAFRTARMSPNESIAIEMIVNGENTVLRDQNLEPVWSGRNRKEKWRRGNKLNLEPQRH